MLNVVAGCQAFVAVVERSSFTAAGAELGMPQPVVSRRVAALESHAGGRLLVRDSRDVTLTPLGRRVLPAAQRVVDAVADLEVAVAEPEPPPLVLAVPQDLPVPLLAALVSDAKESGAPLRLVTAPAAERADLVRDSRADAAVVPAAPGVARWSAVLGAGTGGTPEGHVFLDELAPRRGDHGPPRRVWLTSEDDHAQVGDVVLRQAVASGMLPGQVRVAPLVDALAEVTTSRDLLVCTAGEARRLGLAWAPFGGLELGRGYRLETRPGDAAGAGPCVEALAPSVALALGAAG